MTDSLHIDSGVIQLTVNDDPTRVVKFNPTDILFIERFYQMQKDFMQKQKSFLERSKQLDELNKELDESGNPVHAEESIQFLHEICAYMYEQIDKLFGEGTSQTVFQGMMSLDMIIQFFNSIIPFIEGARTEMVEKYVQKENTEIMK